MNYMSFVEMSNRELSLSIYFVGSHVSWRNEFKINILMMTIMFIHLH